MRRSICGVRVICKRRITLVRMQFFFIKLSSSQNQSQIAIQLKNIRRLMVKFVKKPSFYHISLNWNVRVSLTICQVHYIKKCKIHIRSPSSIILILSLHFFRLGRTKMFVLQWVSKILKLAIFRYNGYISDLHKIALFIRLKALESC